MPDKTFDIFLDELDALSAPTFNEQVLLNQAGGGAKVASLADTFLLYSGSLDVHLYGAKGDTVSYRDATINGNTLTAPQHDFTSADIGKLIYIASTTARTVTAVNVDGNSKKISFSGGSLGGPWSPGQWLMGTDDTAAIYAAIQAAGRNRGNGIAGSLTSGSKNSNWGKAILFRPGHSYLVRNTATDFANGRLAALPLPPRVALVGGAPGAPRQSMIVHAPDSYGHCIANDTVDAFSDFITIANLSIWGTFWFGGGNRQDGININVAFDGYEFVDPNINITNCDVFEHNRDALAINGRGQNFLSHLRLLNNNRYGLFCDNTMDSTFLGIDAGGNLKTGFRLSKTSSSRYVGCKSFYSGVTGGTDPADCANFAIVSDDNRNTISHYIGCESQEARGSGWYIESSRGQYSACASYDPGRATMGSGTRPTVCAGFHLSGNKNEYNIFSDCKVGPSVVIYSSSRWGYGTNAVHIDTGPIGNVGNIWTDPLINYSSTLNPAGTGSAKGGGGTSNGTNTGLRVDGVACT